MRQVMIGADILEANDRWPTTTVDISKSMAYTWST